MSCPAINKQKLPNTPGMKWEQAVLKNEDSVSSGIPVTLYNTELGSTLQFSKNAC